jgi:hypothetical protein
MTEAITTTGEDTTKPETDEPEVAEEFDTTEQEFRNLYQRCDEESAQMKALAMNLQPSAPQAAEALRQVAGNVYPLMQEVIATCGGAFQSIEESPDDDEEGGVGLTDEDAVDFARTLMANNKMIAELREAATDDAVRGRLDAIKAMNDEMLARVLELADMAQEDLDRALAEAESSPEPEAPPPEGEVN